MEVIDSGTKVALAFQRITNPEKAKAADAAKKAEAEKQKKERAGKKAGAWGGLP